MLGILLASCAAFAQAQSVGGGGGTTVYYVSSSADGGVGTWQSNGSGDPFVTGQNVGIGTSSPAAGLHVDGRNVLFSEANVVQSSQYDVGYKVQRIGTANDLGWDNPAFELFRIYKAGVGLPAWAVMCSGTANAGGDNVAHGERICLSHEASGTLASINFNARISGMESYIQNYSYHPWYRLNASPDGRLQMGAGGAQAAIGHAVRTGGNLVTVQTDTDHKFIIGETLKVYPAGNTADPHFCPAKGCTYPVVSAPDGQHFTYADTDTNGANTVALVYSSEVDVEYAREANSSNTEACAVTTAGGHYNWRVCPNRVETDSNVLLKLKGAVQARLWFNGGGQSQLNDTIFLVNSGSGDTTSTLPSATTLGDGYVYLVKNTASNHVVVSSTNGAENIDGSASKTLNSLQACWFISGSNNWWAVCSP